MSNDPVKVKDLAAARGLDNLLYSADTYFRWHESRGARTEGRGM